MLPTFQPQPRPPVVQLFEKPLADYYEASVPMTYILGMVGNDGVILASDKLVTEQIPARCTYSTQKIEILSTPCLAYCWAGDNLCEIVARLLKDLTIDSETNIRDTLTVTAQTAYVLEQRSRAERHDRPLVGGIMFLAIPVNGNVGLWRLAISTPVCAEPIPDKVCAGDIYNTCRFFAERYFPKGSARPSINELMPLAAHSALMAGKLNCGICDLEMVLCRSNGTFERVSAPDLLAMKEKSKTLDRAIGEHLGFRPSDL